ncbi:DMT family transporter [Paracoccus beibuensis]|uniref:DMT family transporter n=1 Tax=Paracoccus beibuensis TaxID=547602 RepID=UPI00223F473B|nr:DMT family transporter [Paracoccus beibuensis]
MKCTSVAVFTVMAALIKATSETVPPGQQVFFRSFFALPVILIWLAWRRELGGGLRTRQPLGHLWRGILGTAAMVLNFWALSLLTFPEVTAIGYASPLLVVVLAGLFLGEDVRAFRLGMVGLGLTGVLIVLSPQLLGTQAAGPMRGWGAAIALGGAFCAALAQIFVRKLVQGEQVAAIVFWFSVTSSVIGMASLPWGWTMLDARTGVMLIMAGLLGGFAQILLTASYRHADASIIAPFDYVSMLLAVIIGWWIFGERLTLPALLGALLVITAGILIIWREHRLGLERNRQRRAGIPPA